MLSESDIDAAHPDAFDFVFGNLPKAKRADFNRHLIGCRYCQAVVDEYSDIGQIIQSLPPHVAPPADLEDRTIAAMVAALADQRAQADRRTEDEDQDATRVYPVPQLKPPVEPETQLQPPAPGQASPTGSQARAMVTRLPVWRRHPRRLVAVLAVAAAIIIAALVVIPRLSGGPAPVSVVIPLHATTAAKLIGDGSATGRATARQADQSWTFDLTVHGLKPLSGNDFYECWWVTPGHTRLLATGGSFVVGSSGSTTVTMTTGVDPTQQFRTMEITAETPSKDGALNGPVLLTG